MKNGAAAIVLFLSGCGTVQWVPAPEVGQSNCTASCNAHYKQCPEVFARFPERGAVECPAEHDQCLKACENAKGPAAASPAAASPAAASPAAASPAAATPPAPAAAGSAPAVGSKEARLRELKHFYDQGLVTEDVYRDRQKAILSEP
jgi:hypothetical protein